MTVVFEIQKKDSGEFMKVKTTLIDYIEADGVGEAFNKAAEYKHEVIIKIAKGESDMWNKKAWGETSEDISISLDAVVAKPDIEGPLPINIAGRYRSPSGMIPVSRKTLKLCPELLRDKNFFSSSI